MPRDKFECFLSTRMSLMNNLHIICSILGFCLLCFLLFLDSTPVNGESEQKKEEMSVEEKPKSPAQEDNNGDTASSPSRWTSHCGSSQNLNQNQNHKCRQWELFAHHSKACESTHDWSCSFDWLFCFSLDGAQAALLNNRHTPMMKQTTLSLQRQKHLLWKAERPLKEW